jgi:hypothetical protein
MKTKIFQKGREKEARLSPLQHRRDPEQKPDLEQLLGGSQHVAGITAVQFSGAVDKPTRQRGPQQQADECCKDFRLRERQQCRKQQDRRQGNLRRSQRRLGPRLRRGLVDVQKSRLSQRQGIGDIACMVAMTLSNDSQSSPRVSGRMVLLASAAS